MSRRRKKPVQPTAWVDWSPAIAELFEPRILTAGAEPPARVRVFYGTQHWTVVAHFQRPDGFKVTSKLRIKRAGA